MTSGPWDALGRSWVVSRRAPPEPVIVAVMAYRPSARAVPPTDHVPEGETTARPIEVWLPPETGAANRWTMVPGWAVPEKVGLLLLLTSGVLMLIVSLIGWMTLTVASATAAF